ncbi:MAG TPA: hypothetical protein VH765_01705 [Xanthobacteraceae bacterium]|jgi:hypothetical protein
MTQYRVRFLQIPRWLALVVGALAIAFAIALFLLSLTVFLLVLPALAVAGALYYLFGLPRKGRRTRDDVEVIEGEYRVIEPERVENGRKRP